MQDERAPAFITEARSEAAKLGLEADFFNASDDFADFDFYVEAPAPGREYRVLVSVGLSDGKVMPAQVTERDSDGPDAGEAEVDYDTLPVDVCEKAESLSSTLREVAGRHYPSPPAMSFG